MIYLSDIKDPVIKKYMSEECGNVFSVRVKSLIKAYGGYERLIDIWYQKNRFDNVSAYIVKYSGEFIADILDFADTEEITDMCSLAGGAVLLCKAENENFCSGIVMKLEKSADIACNYKVADDVNLKDYYALLKSRSNSEFSVNEFKDFYVDLNHKIRKSCAAIKGIYQSGGVLVSGCTASAIYGNSAVIAGVATKREFENRGLASYAVSELCKTLESSGICNIYLQRHKDKNYNFYHKIGFEDTGLFYQINLNP